MKIKKIQRVSALCFAVFCTLFIGAAYRMETCGYNCGLFSISSGMAVVVYYVIFFWLGLLSLTISLGAGLYILKTKDSENQLK